MKKEIEKLLKSLMAKQTYAWEKYRYYKKLPSLDYKTTEQRWYSKYEAYGFCIDRLIKILEDRKLNPKKSYYGCSAKTNCRERHSGLTK